MKSVQSVKCRDCGEKYRTSFRKGGKVPARNCPACNSDKYEVLVADRAEAREDLGQNF